MTVLCIAGFLGCFLKSIALLSPSARSIGWFPAYLSLSSILGILSLSGLWLMRRWGVWGYSLLAAANQAVYQFIGEGKWITLVLFWATTAAGWLYYRYMK